MAGETLDASELSTKEYWQNFYETECRNFDEFEDSGEIWFGLSTERRIVKYLVDKYSNSKEKCRILDLGCGNGSLLLSLAKKEFKNLYGVDYASGAIQLANKIADKEKLNVAFKECDILDEANNLKTLFDIVLDKGTFDAISLMKNSRNFMETYKRNLHNLFDFNCNSDRIFIIASCNWTKEELEKFFAPEFKFVEELQTPSFYFGGMNGKAVTICIFNALKIC